MKESQIQKKIIDYLRSIGCYVVKTVVASRGGVPDLLVCFNGQFYAFEVKKEDGVVSSLQNLNINQIRNARGKAYVVRSLSEVKELMEPINIGLPSLSGRSGNTKTLNEQKKNSHE